MSQTGNTEEKQQEPMQLDGQENQAKLENIRLRAELARVKSLRDSTLEVQQQSAGSSMNAAAVEPSVSMVEQQNLAVVEPVELAVSVVNPRQEAGTTVAIRDGPRYIARGRYRGTYEERRRYWGPYSRGGQWKGRGQDSVHWYRVRSGGYVLNINLRR